MRSSFVKPAPQRELRELTRSRLQLIETHSREADRVQEVLETANIKLGDVATDVPGASGRAMLKGLIAGERDPMMLAGLAQGRLREKRAALEQARPKRSCCCLFARTKETMIVASWLFSRPSVRPRLLVALHRV